MRKIYLKLGDDNFTKMRSNQEPKEDYDYIITEYPEDYIGNELKYIISASGSELIFDIRPDYEEWISATESNNI